MDDEDENNAENSVANTRGYVIRRIIIILLTHAIIIGYLSYVTYYYVSTSRFSTVFIHIAI